MKLKRLIYVSPHDPENVLNWSGTLYFLYRSLQRNNPDLKIQSMNLGLTGRLAQIVAKVLWKFGVRGDLSSTTFFAVLKGFELTLRTMLIRDAVIVAVAASNDIAYLKTKKKIIYISDGTFDAVVKMYSRSAAMISDFKKAFPNWIKRQCEQNQSRALAKARYSIFSSQWAVDSAALHYGVPRDRLFYLPFGPNISEELIEANSLPKSISPAGEVRFLFVSADWKRKNGDVVVEICRQLIKSGVRARLVTVGATAESAKRLDFVEDLGFLKKSKPEELARLCNAYGESHFMLLPSLVDYSPIVFTEAQAFGVPPVSTDVGGISSMIDHRENGLLLPTDAGPEKFVEAILPYVSDPPSYQRLSRQCRDWYLQRANWNNWSRLIVELARRQA